MNIYLLERTDKVGWDETRGVVVVAESEELARSWFPNNKFPWTKGIVPRWDIACTLVGIACEGVEAGVILQDFKAG